MLDYYLNILLKRWLLIAISFIGVGVAVYFGSKLTTPVYQSTAVVQVAVSANNSQANIDALQASNMLVQTEAQLAISNSVLSEVVSHYSGLSVSQLAKNTTATIDANTQLFQISVTDTSSTRAAALANDIAQTLIKQQTEASQQINTQSQQNIKQELNQTLQQIESISSNIANLNATAVATPNVTPSNNAQISTLQVKLTSLQQHYTQWQSLLAQLELTQAQSGRFLIIAQIAQPASAPTGPHVLSNTAIGLLVGLLNGLFLAMLLEQLDTRVHTAEDITKLLEWPVLATTYRPNSSKANTVELVNPPSNNVNVEAYRMLRTNLGFAVIDRTLHTIMVTSTMPQEGKSTTAANLAIFMAKAGKKTLLIDADLRRPQLAELFNLRPGCMGLSNAIVACAQSVLSTTGPLFQPSMPFPVGGFSLSPFMHTANIPNLQIMPSGPLPPNPPELLDSKAMASFLASLSICGAEVIIFDVPPLLGLSDANILASKVDGILVVVDITRANKKHLKQAKALLAQFGSKVLGLVVNKQRQNRKDTVYYNYPTPAEEKSQSLQNGHFPLVPPTPVLPRSLDEQ